MVGSDTSIRTVDQNAFLLAFVAANDKRNPVLAKFRCETRDQNIMLREHWTFLNINVSRIEYHVTL